MYLLNGNFAVGAMNAEELSSVFSNNDFNSRFESSSVTLFNQIEIRMDKGMCSFYLESEDINQLTSNSEMISEALKDKNILHVIEVADEDWNTLHEYTYER
ncbi:MAG: hypothetical protein COA78_10855 [Blastopirellula sp.]|nr:MAG: hypothetical protein COA78_10855 [Blastopirellula sp.]